MFISHMFNEFDGYKCTLKYSYQKQPYLFLKMLIKIYKGCFLIFNLYLFRYFYFGIFIRILLFKMETKKLKTKINSNVDCDVTTKPHFYQSTNIQTKPPIT